MATRLYLDTHAVVWLHQGDLTKFSRSALRVLEDSALVYSPAVLLELQFLAEIGRIAPSPEAILTDLRQDIGLEVGTELYLDVMRWACRESWTRDPFDRAIVAHARMSECTLLTRDRKIQERYEAAFW